MTNEELYQIGLISEAGKLKIDRLISFLTTEPYDPKFKEIAVDNLISIIQSERLEAAADMLALVKKNT